MSFLLVSNLFQGGGKLWLDGDKKFELDEADLTEKFCRSRGNGNFTTRTAFTRI